MKASNSSTSTHVLHLSTVSLLVYFTTR